MRTISVPAHTYDRKHYGVPKYDNNEEWNRPGRPAPNGVSAYRWLRDTTPNVAQLSPLAAWLVANVPPTVAGTMPHPQKQYRVRCYNGKTIAEQNNWSDAQIRTWAPHGDKLAMIDDYLFPIIQPKQSDSDYWNAVAQSMIEQGIIRVVIGASEWSAQ